MKFLFKETQYLRQWWLWLILIGITLIPIWGIYQQVFLEQPFGDRPMPDTVLYIFLAFMLLLLWLFWKMNLSTKINNEMVSVNFFPFANKEFKWQDIKEAEVLNYGFVGGWGVRMGTKYGTVYNTSGNTGLALKLKNGKKYCIGTQREIELRKVVQQCLVE